MSCLNPIVAVSLCKDNITLKQKLKFVPTRVDFDINSLKQKYGPDNVYLLPCGKCEPCRKSYSNEWAIRCQCEAYSHDFNYFLTLTFDDYHIKKASLKDLQLFIRKLKFYDKHLKYFSCLEEGELTSRLHFHVVLFMDKPLELYDPVKLGDFYHYHCKRISDLWSYGLHDITPFEFYCAAYVAKYSAKGSNRCYMSRNIGKKYFMSHFQEIAENDFKIYGHFGKKDYVDIPKAFARWFIEMDFLSIDDYRLNRIKRQRLLVLSGLHSLGASHEEDTIINNRYLNMKDKLYRRVL